MSQKFGICFKSIGILALLPLLLSLVACDPCRQLAEQICKCRETNEERRSCLSDLSLAGQHHFIKEAKQPEVCEEALKNCSCKKINDSQDAQCGMYRQREQRK